MYAIIKFRVKPAASNQEIRGREIVVNRRGGGGGGHAGGGGGHTSGGHGGGSGHSKGGGSDGNAKGLAVAGVVPLYAAGALNHQNYNNEKKPHHRGSNGSNTNYVGQTQFVFPLLALPLSLSYLLFPFKGHLV